MSGSDCSTNCATTTKMQFCRDRKDSLCLVCALFPQKDFYICPQKFVQTIVEGPFLDHLRDCFSLLFISLSLYVKIVSLFMFNSLIFLSINLCSIGSLYFSFCIHVPFAHIYLSPPLCSIP